MAYQCAVLKTEQISLKKTDQNKEQSHLINEFLRSLCLRQS